MRRRFPTVLLLLLLFSLPARAAWAPEIFAACGWRLATKWAVPEREWLRLADFLQERHEDYEWDKWDPAALSSLRVLQTRLRDPERTRAFLRSTSRPGIDDIGQLQRDIVHRLEIETAWVVAAEQGRLDVDAIFREAPSLLPTLAIRLNELRAGNWRITFQTRPIRNPIRPFPFGTDAFRCDFVRKEIRIRVGPSALPLPITVLLAMDAVHYGYRLVANREHLRVYLTSMLLDHATGGNEEPVPLEVAEYMLYWRTLGKRAVWAHQKLIAAKDFRFWNSQLDDLFDRRRANGLSVLGDYLFAAVRGPLRAENVAAWRRGLQWVDRFDLEDLLPR